MAWTYPLIERLLAGQDRWLIEHPSIERALGAAWATARPAGRRQLISALLQSRHPEAPVHLIRRMQALDAASQEELARRVDRLQAPLRRCLSAANDSDVTTIKNALTLIAQGAAGELAYLVVAKLRHPTPEIRAAAGAALRRLAQQASAMDAKNASRLIETVNTAVVNFAHHRHPAVLRAWLALAPRGLTVNGTAVEALQDAEHPAVEPMRDLLKHADGPEVRQGLVAALALPTLALAAVAGLRVCVQAGELDPVIAGRQHLLDLPAVRRGLARGGDPTELMPASAAAEPLDGPAADPAWAAWIAALPLSALGRTARLGDLMRSGRTATRLAAVRGLLPLATSGPGDDPRAAHEARRHLGEAAQHDPDLSVARVAGVWLLSKARSEPEVLGVVSRSRHEALRTLAGRRLGATAFEKLWAAWPRLGDRSRLDAARAALRLDPTARTRLESRLRGGGPLRQRAIEIVTVADQAGFLDGLPEGQASNTSPRVQASASATLAGSEPR